MEYNPSQYIVKAFSRRQSLWVGIGTVLGEAIPHRSEEHTSELQSHR